MKTIFYNGKIFTFENENSNFEAVLIEDEFIKKLGKNKDILVFRDENTQVIDLKNNVLLPAFIDTHTHFFEFARMNFDVDLNPAKSVKEIEKILINYKKNMHPNRKWIGGSGWEFDKYPDQKLLNRFLLDKVFPDIPVSFQSRDFHTNLCNTKALEVAGINKETPNPKGGKIGHFEDGTPDGYIYEAAWMLLDKVKPKIDDELRSVAVKTAIKQMWKFGLAGVHVMEEEAFYDLYKAIDKQEYPFRFYWHFPEAILDSAIKRGFTSYSGDEFSKICGMKIFMDGSLGSRSALMYDEYEGFPGNFGRAIYSAEELYEIVKKAAQHNISSSIHAIGDRCCNIVINVFEKVNSEVDKNLMHRIEHLQNVKLEDLPRVSKNKIHCALQPIHLKEDIDNIKKFWSKTEKQVYAFNSIIKNNIDYSFGSDAPVETINPFLGIYAAITRKPHNNPDLPGWNPSERISVWDALRGYTINAAKASKSEHLRGSIKENKLADLIVIEDFTKFDDTYWLKAESLLTMVNGKITHNSLS